MEDGYTTIDDAANDLGVNKATVWRWIKRNEMSTFRRIGERRTFMRSADVESLRKMVLQQPDAENRHSDESE